MRRQPETLKDDLQRNESVHTYSSVVVPKHEEVRNEGKFHEESELPSLLKQVVAGENMQSALKRVLRNRGTSGTDGMEVTELSSWYEVHGAALCESIRNGDYRPQVVRKVEIPKPGGTGTRVLGIPSAIDRMVQQAILQVLTPLIDPTFSESSFGFRPGRSAHQAMNYAKEYIKAGFHYVVDIDIENFFTRVNHDILISRVARRISDKGLLRLIRRILETGIMINGCAVRSEEGVPQGGPLSPLLSNILLDELDKELEARGHRFCRYADDVNVYVQSTRAPARVQASITEFLAKRLRLKVNEAKSAVDLASRRPFLSFSFLIRKVKDQVNVRIRVAPKAVARFRSKIRMYTKGTSGRNIEALITRLNRYLPGWLHYFKIAETPSTFENLQGWLHRRLRMVQLREWKLCDTRRRNLMARGLKEDEARRIAGSRKGKWHLARTPQLHKAMGQAYWKDLGLFELHNSYTFFRNKS